MERVLIHFEPQAKEALEWLAKGEVDVVLVRESIKGKRPEYVFADAGLKVRITEATPLQEASVRPAVIEPNA